jgi:hypothetical protein
LEIRHLTAVAIRLNFAFNQFTNLQSTKLICARLIEAINIMTAKGSINTSTIEVQNDAFDAVKTGSTHNQKPDLKKIGNWIMVACCVPMVIGAGILLWAMGPDATWSNRISTLAPLALCFGAHFVMHKLIGRSCHNTQNVNKDEK